MDTVDYIIVGGGVYGCAIAWHLAKQGADVLLLEKERIASGASGGSGERGVRANGRDVRELPLMKHAYDLWPRLEQELQTPITYKRAGHLLLVERERDMPSAQARIWVQNQQGIETKWASPEDLRIKEPDFADHLGAVCCPNDGTAEHGQVTRAYAFAAQQLGAQIQEQTTVSKYKDVNGAITSIITTSGQEIAVRRKVLLLANTAIPSILNKHFRTTIPVWHRYFQVIIMPKIADVKSHHLIGHANRCLAIKTLPDARIQISGGWYGHWDDNEQKCFPIEAEVQGNLEAARSAIPALKDIEPEVIDLSRCDTESYDGVPIIDSVPSFENVLYATGWTGHGWAIAPAVAEFLSQWAESNERPDILKPFGLSRFLH